MKLKQCDYGSLTKDHAMRAIKLYSEKSLISEEKLTSLYTNFGIDVFFIFTLFEDSRIVFLPKEKLTEIVNLTLSEEDKTIKEEPIDFVAEYINCPFCNYPWEVTDEILKNGLTCDSCQCFSEKDVVVKKKYKRKI